MCRAATDVKSNKVEYVQSMIIAYFGNTLILSAGSRT